MASISAAFDPMHPLLADRERLDRIADLMFAKIHKTLFFQHPGPRRAARTERILDGTAVSADDVVAQALEALLQYPPSRLRGSWEALAVGIAHKKAVSALRASQKGLRGTEHREPLRLVPGDTHGKSPGRESEPAPFEVLASDWGDPEKECSELERALKLRDLARDALDERSRHVFFAIHFKGRLRAEIGGRTPPDRPESWPDLP